MYANATHANRPTVLTRADRARQAAAVRAHDARIARAAANNRLFRLAYHCAAVALVVAMFYSATV